MHPTARRWLVGALSGAILTAADPGRTGLVVNPGVDTVVPQVVDGAGWSTSFYLMNLEPGKTIFWQLKFYSDSGGGMVLPLLGTGPAATVFASLPPQWSVVIETPGTATALQQGWASVVTLDRSADQPGAVATNDRIGGLATFRQRVPGRPDFEAVVPFSPINENRFVMPFDNRAGFSTGIAWLNPDFNVVAPAEVTIRNAEGVILRQETLNLLPGSKLVFSMPERYPEAIGRYGRINVSTTARLLSGLGLRFNPTGAFTSFHTLSTAP
jgi:hypothetical protein